MGVAILAVKAFLQGRRVLYATPTQEQIDRFWTECKWALEQPINAGVFYKNETRHIIERPGTENRIRAKTAWNADTLRGDYADLLILDEYQLMSEDAWGLVGAPMMLDTNGDAVFIYTAIRGQHHSKELFKRAMVDETGRWAVFSFSSFANPHLSPDALDELAQDMTNLGYRMEILAEDIDDDPRALWNRGAMIDAHRVSTVPPLGRIVVGVDPPGGRTECGIVVAGTFMQNNIVHGYVLDDRSLAASPAAWAREVIAAYSKNSADRVIGESNYGGDMVEHTIRSVEGGKNVAYKSGHATRGKAIRAEPIAALYEQGRVHHVGTFQELEDEMCTWVPDEGMPSPNRLDALVWALSELMLGRRDYKKPGTVKYA